MKISYSTHGSGECAVIFLHGIGSGKEGWRLQAKPTVEAGFRFLALDAPGFGGTPLPDKAGFTPHVGAVLALMDKENLETALLCGHSLGGMTAQEVYAHYPERVSGLVLSATSPAFGKPDGEFQKEFLRARFEPFDQGMTMPDFAQKFAKKLMGPSPGVDAEQEIIDVMSQVTIEAYRMAMNTLVGFDQRANLPSITVPTLLVAGENDSNSPAKMMEKMSTYITGCQFKTLAETGHMAPLENPDGFNLLLKNFLNNSHNGRGA